MTPIVLILSSYPFVEPRHGGQVRLANIAKAYEVAGWSVESIALYEPEGHGTSPLARNDLPFPQHSPHRLFRGRNVPLINDLLSGAYAISEDGGFPFVRKRLPPRIDVIHVEQPWMWPLAIAVRSMREYANVILIYGSANIEAPLKREVLGSFGVSDVDDVIDAVDALERQAAREADLSLAVTQTDLDVLAGYDAKQLLLAPNGIAPWVASVAALERWRLKLPTAPWILYIASAHPPNFTGFTTRVGNSLGCIPPDSKLVVAGSVCEHLYQRLAVTRWHTLSLSRLELLFILSDDDLAAVKTLAHAFLLPIQHGGGSNIKTAEALYSGAYVIGSQAAFRGFEELTTLPEVVVAHSPYEFQMAIRDILQRPPRVPAKTIRGDLRHSLQWDQCLACIPDAVSKIMQSRSK